MLPSVFGVAVVAALLLTPQVIRLAEARQLLDQPTGGRRVHTVPVPRLGGVAVFLSVVLALGASLLVDGVSGSIAADDLRFFTAVLVGGGLLFLVGLVDDLRGLPPMVKLAGQVAVGGIFYAFGFRIDALTTGPASYVEIGVLSVPLTILWIVVVTNAFNLIDGLDGLATGVAMVALAATSALAILMDRHAVLVVALAMLGALGGFLRYNFRPARIFLGDSGSLFIGCMLAVLSVHGSTRSASAMLSVAPMLVLALPLIDTSLAILRRWLRGVSFSAADKRHIHHQLLARGLTHLKAVLVLYVVASLLAIFGLMLAFAPTSIVSLIALGGGVVAVALLLWGLGYLDYHEFFVAGSVLARAPLRLRTAIRDQIHARDVAQVIQVARSLEEVNAILSDNAGNFDFLDLAVCRESESRRRQPLLIADGHVGRASKLEYPITPHELDLHDPYVLRVWYRPDASRPYGAERVARVLAPTLHSWILHRSPHRKLPVPLSVAEVHPALEAAKS